MRQKFVIDTGVLSLFFSGDTRLKSYFDQLGEGKAEGYISSVNLSEYVYKTCEKLGIDVATLRYHQARSIIQVIDTDRDLSLEAGKQKCRNRSLSLADCFALALSKRLGGLLLTTDSALGDVKDIDAKSFKV